MHIYYNKKVMYITRLYFTWLNRYDEVHELHTTMVLDSLVLSFKILHKFNTVFKP